MDNIILFDGVCNFCDHSVQFIIKRDKHAFYKFASIQSDVGKELIKKHKVPIDIDSLILIEHNTCYYKSTAALRICKHLKGGWKLLTCLLIFPKPIRDYFYEIIAKNRYKWFGKKESCMIPTSEDRVRFIEDYSIDKSVG